MIEGRIVIAGAGIGGLCLAHALKRAGKSVIVLERANHLGAVGAGIAVQANAIKALAEIGLDRAVIEAGQAVRKTELRHFRGRVLMTTPADVEERAGAPTIVLHRAWLHEVLLGAVGPGVVKTGFSVATYEQTPKHVRVIADDDREVHGSILVGADGLWSKVRSKLVGDGPPVYAGYTSWRGVADASGLVPEGYTSESWGSGERFGIASLGRGKVYWFATANVRVGERDPEDARAALLERFRGWHAPVEDLLRRTPREAILRTDIFDRPPIRRWSDGRVTLLGDAAHPMTPNLGQGGCQAIEDAVVLARALVQHEDLVAAFREYERARVDRANGIAEKSRNFGHVGQWSGGASRFLRDAAVRLTPKAVLLRQMLPVLRFES